MHSLKRGDGTLGSVLYLNSLCLENDVTSLGVRKLSLTFVSLVIHTTHIVSDITPHITRFSEVYCIPSRSISLVHL